MRNAVPVEIRVAGVSRLDVLDFEEDLPADAIRFETPVLGSPGHGEVATVAIVAIAALALRALTAVLLKRRKGAAVERTIQIVDASGQVRTETLRVHLSESSPPEAQVLSALTKLLEIDIKAIG
jgi:hypothetical protein